jgi:hypothetical protein
MLGLDSPKLGIQSPALNLSIPIKSLWLVGVLYYNPTVGGCLSLDFDGLIDFVKILFLDRRTWTLSTMFNIFNRSYSENNSIFIIFFKLRLHFILEDIIQIFEIIYFDISNYVYYYYFYVIFLFNYFGVVTPLMLYLLLIYFYKFNVFFEKI